MATFYQTLSADTSPPKLYASFVAKGKQKALAGFKKVLHQSAFMHLSFTLFILCSLSLSITLLTREMASIYTPASFALLFLSIASYTLIAFYQKNKKLDAIEKICNEFRHHCSLHLAKNIEDTEQLHLATAECMRDLTTSLQTGELFYLSIHPFKFSGSHITSHFLYFHYNDILYCGEKLLDISLQQHSLILEDCACSLEFHSSLSKTYATLTSLYKRPEGKHLEKAYTCSTLFKKEELESLKEKYYTLAEEETKIVCELCDNEPWSVAELASLYATFGESEKEMKAYELLNSKVSEDKEILYKLGTLYFKHLKTAKGLKIYNRLRKIDALFAKNLLSHYHSIT